MRKKGYAITKSEAELAFKEIDVAHKHDQLIEELKLKTAEEDRKVILREKRLRGMVRKITTSNGIEDPETEAIRLEAGLAPNYTFFQQFYVH